MGSVYRKGRQSLNKTYLIRVNMTTNKDFEEIYLERTSYLLSTDDLLEQILEDRYSIMPINQIGQKIDMYISQNEIGLEIAF